MRRYPFTWPVAPGFPDELAGLRTEPLVEVALPSGDKALLVTRYEDVRKVLLDPRVSHNLERPDAARMTSDDMLFRDPNVNYDPPDHPRARRIVAKAFTPARVELLRPRLAEIADGLIAEMRPGAELNAAFAYPLTIEIICELLGVPTSDQGDFRVWTEDVLLLGTSANEEKVMNALAELYGYSIRMVELKREHPGDDLVSALIAARDEDESTLTEHELLHWIMGVLIGGYHTTAAALGGALVTLFAHPAELERLRNDISLLDRAVEELLRWGGVAQPLPTLRYVTEDVQIDGAVIPAGSSIVAAIDSANRDVCAFKDPDKVDIGRAENPHVAFGLGHHFCVGAALARATLQEGIRALLTRLPNIALAVPLEELKRHEGVIFQDFAQIPVTW